MGVTPSHEGETALVDGKKYFWGLNSENRGGLVSVEILILVWKT